MKSVVINLTSGEVTNAVTIERKRDIRPVCDGKHVILMVSSKTEFGRIQAAYDAIKPYALTIKTVDDKFTDQYMLWHRYSNLGIV